ncbi:MAG: restriction endonuclease [Chloroflexi bacterium]|nr:restriction endonuclease [Chloroflexota bacterium]MBP8058865.1 restriction endonuclease [Chloroflexota bacterium]
MPTLVLTEYQTVTLPANALTPEMGLRLHRQFGQQIQVVAPSILNGHQWQLTAQGWVGTIPLTPDLTLLLQPKVPLANLFGMVEMAYSFEPRWLDGLAQVGTLAEFYDRLAAMLARKVLHRGRNGFHRTYISHTDFLPTVRGQLNLRRVLRNPHSPVLECEYEEHTVDNEDNRILAWTLRQIARSGLCTPATHHLVAQAFRTLQRVVTVEPISPARCVGRHYTRLNQDYQPLHALCRFFLEQSGPTHQEGDHLLLPFLLDMALLFERFAAAWLQHHLPPPWQVKIQEHILVDPHSHLTVRPDIVLYQADQPYAILDTKYKIPHTIQSDDFSQVVAYAQVKNCPLAILLYPQEPSRPLNITLPHVHIRTLAFPLDGDLDKAGQALLAELLRP